MSYLPIPPDPDADAFDNYKERDISNWPECMAPDGAEPCAAYSHLIERIAKLEAVYTAVLPLKLSGTHLYDCDIALGKAIKALEETK